LNTARNPIPALSVAITSDGQVYFTGSSRDVVAAYEISITDGNYTGRLNLLFNLGSKYDGKTYTIYHEKKSGEIEKYTAVCTEGKVAIAIDELSPFLITIAVQADSDNVILSDRRQQ
jgi:hypothetical protein